MNQNLSKIIFAKTDICNDWHQYQWEELVTVLMSNDLNQ